MDRVISRILDGSMDLGPRWGKGVHVTIVTYGNTYVSTKHLGDPCGGQGRGPIYDAWEMLPLFCIFQKMKLPSNDILLNNLLIR